LESPSAQNHVQCTRTRQGFKQDPPRVPLAGLESTSSSIQQDTETG